MTQNTIKADMRHQILIFAVSIFCLWFQTTSQLSGEAGKQKPSSSSSSSGYYL